MIYGWGKKSKDWAMPDGRTLVCSYSYVSLMFVFKFVWSRKWHLIGRDRAMDVETNRQDLERTYGQGNVPDIGVFERFGMFVTGGLIVGAVLLMAGVQSLFGSDTQDVATAAGLSGDPVAVLIDSDDELDGEIDSESADEPIDEAGTESEQALERAGDGGQDDSNSPPTTDGSAADSAQAGTDSTLSNGTVGEGSSESDGETTPVASGLYETARITEPIGGERLASTNADSPTQGWSELTVHEVYATSVLGEEEAAEGEKHVVVEYQLLGMTAGANVLNSTFRLDVDGIFYSPTLSWINDVAYAGTVINSSAIFTVPAETKDFRFEVGALEAAGDGYQSSYEFSLTPGEAPAAPERFAGPDQVGTVTMLSDSNEMTGYPASVQQPPGEIQVLDVQATPKVGPDAARPGFKFVVVELQIIGKSGSANLQDPAFRMTAEGELYPGIGGLNEVMQAGKAWNGSLRFEVPASATVVQFEAGVPASWDVGHRALFEIELS